MVAYVRARQSLWAAVGLLVGLILIVWNLWNLAPSYISKYPVVNDFRLAYSAAAVGIKDGYSHLYDLAAQKTAIENLGPGFNPQPFISPPPLAWLVTPLLALPFNIALVIWTLALLAALVLAWHLLAPPGRLTRAAHLALLLGLFPVAFGVMVGQPGALVAAVVVASWWLMRQERPVLAGLVLSLIVVKPQLALLVPLCVLASGRAKTFGSWLAASIFIGLIALAMLGSEGVARYLAVLADTQSPAWDITRRYSISGPLGLGPLLNATQLLVLIITLVVAWRHRHGGPEVPLAAGLLGSLLFTPYLAFQDFLMLVVVAWLLLRSPLKAWQVGLLVLGYVLLEFALVVMAVPILVAEALLLLSLLAGPPAQAPGDLSRVHGIVGGHVADE
ncbi:MAG TPA: glycosyltransferase family 87 protein [Candidatus Dormibacteraeota bacterium]